MPDHMPPLQFGLNENNVCSQAMNESSRDTDDSMLW